MQGTDQRETTVAWTGHRPDLFADPAEARATVFALASELFERKPSIQFLVGGQRGVDTWAAQAATALGIAFTLILPLPRQDFVDDVWSSQDRAELERLMDAAATVEIVSRGDRARASTERNRQLATRGELLVAVWTGIVHGGTAETLSFARAHRTPIREVLLAASRGAATATGRGV
jgi:hypothetical protein